MCRKYERKRKSASGKLVGNGINVLLHSLNFTFSFLFFVRCSLYYYCLLRLNNIFCSAFCVARIGAALHEIRCVLNSHQHTHKHAFLAHSQEKRLGIFRHFGEQNPRTHKSDKLSFQRFIEYNKNGNSLMFSGANKRKAPAKSEH